MHTICRDCVFAEWEGKQQIQCKFDRLDKFVEAGIEVVEEEDPDTNVKYFKILNRFCNTCRHPDTLEGIPARKYMEKVRQEIIPHICMSVYVDELSEQREVVNTLESICRQTLKPYEILLIYNAKGANPPPAYPQWLIEHANDFSWRIETIKGVMTITNDMISGDYGDAIDIAVRSESMKATYFVVAKAGYHYRVDYIQTIDEAINNEMKRFVALLPDSDGNGLFVQTGLHKIVQGNKKMHGYNNVIEKIEFVANDEGTSHMIKRFEDLDK